MQKIRLILLCYCTDTACTGKQQGADNAVNRFHSVIVGLCLQFPKVAAKVRILPKINERNALRNNIVHFKTENPMYPLIFAWKPLFCRYYAMRIVFIYRLCSNVAAWIFTGVG